MTTIENERYYTVNEAAEVLHVSAMTVRRYIQKGALHGVKLSRIWIKEAEVQRLVREGVASLEK